MYDWSLVKLVYLHSTKLIHLLLAFSVTRKKSPNVYKSCQKMISLEKLKILEPTQKLPKTVGEIAKSGHTAGFT